MFRLSVASFYAFAKPYFYRRRPFHHGGLKVRLLLLHFRPQLSRTFLTWILWCLLLGAFVPPVFHFAARKFDPYKLAFETARQSPEFILGSVKPRSSGRGYKRLGSHVTGESFAAQCTFSSC